MNFLTKSTIVLTISMIVVTIPMFSGLPSYRCMLENFY
ncbi:phenol soluble modulin delta [Staphylococcus caprae]|uniref:Phenol soluble modulin delta n=1 Tax=Staphylococcus caprae TaxID=29380 RepID=A0ABN5W638_9STAP|nr:phenol soluble modulin delta [Staphylococcus caprae]BBD93506.1 phenol soluble modulin delta [Staphylococcus caprae]BBD96007.1 phenol soluble modulin delta [Staphylococcus caprae]